MKRWTSASAALWLSVLIAGSAGAVDHNNIDAGRPLSFDDAEAIAYRERAVEAGHSLIEPSRRDTGLVLDLEFLYGFALNTHASLDIDPSWGGRADDDETRFDPGNLSVGVLHNFNREYGGVPAFAVRGDVTFPTGRDAKGVDTRVRGILSRTVFQYSRVHLNVDGTFAGEAEDGERDFQPAAILGLSRPIGYPRHFQSTGLAEFGVRSGELKGSDAVLLVGIGLRRQITVRSVVDIGVESELPLDHRDPHDDVRLTAGYSFGF